MELAIALTASIAPVAALFGYMVQVEVADKAAHERMIERIDAENA